MITICHRNPTTREGLLFLCLMIKWTGFPSPLLSPSFPLLFFLYLFYLFIYFKGWRKNRSKPASTATAECFPSESRCPSAALNSNSSNSLVLSFSFSFFLFSFFLLCFFLLFPSLSSRRSRDARQRH